MQFHRTRRAGLAGLVAGAALMLSAAGAVAPAHAAEPTATPAAAACASHRPCWLKARDGWRPVPRAIWLQIKRDGEPITRHARIKFGDTSVVDLDGRCGGRRITS